MKVFFALLLCWQVTTSMNHAWAAEKAPGQSINDGDVVRDVWPGHFDLLQIRIQNSREAIAASLRKPGARPVTVAVWQMRNQCGGEAGKRDNLRRMVEAIERASREQVQILVLPEMCLPGYFTRTAGTPAEATRANHELADRPAQSEFIRQLREAARGKNMVLAFGFCEREADKYYNSIGVIDADGTWLGTRRKNPLSPGPYDLESFTQPPADQRCAVFRTRYATVGVSNCFDGEFPESVRRMRLAGAELLLWCNAGTGNIAVGSSNRIHHSASYAQANQMWVASCNAVGKECYGTSVIVGPQGEPLVVLPTDREVFGLATINLAMGAQWDNWRQRLDPQLLEPPKPCLQDVVHGAEVASPGKTETKVVDLGNGTAIELVFIPPGEFMMGSTPEEKKWATGIEGGAQPGTTRESFEGEQPRLTRVRNGFWMGRTEVSVGQFRRFVEESGFVTDAEKPGGETQVFDPEWDGYHLTTKVVHPWKSMKGKSWRDPNWAFPNRDVFPVVCVSYNDMKAFCKWLTERERKAGRLPEGLEYRLPTEAEWEHGCRGGSKESLYFWWGNEIEEGEGRLNISAMDFLPGRKKTWPLAKAPWSDGFPFVSPVDHYGEKGRNGFGLADMCGGVWEFVLDHFDPKGGHEEVYYEDAQRHTVSRPVCRGGNYFDVPGNARCAVRLGIRSVTYSDSRDGFRICLGVPQKASQ